MNVDECGTKAQRRNMVHLFYVEQWHHMEDTPANVPRGTPLLTGVVICTCIPLIRTINRSIIT